MNHKKMIVEEVVDKTINLLSKPFKNKNLAKRLYKTLVNMLGVKYLSPQSVIKTGYGIKIFLEDDKGRYSIMLKRLFDTNQYVIKCGNYGECIIRTYPRENPYRFEPGYTIKLKNYFDKIKNDIKTARYVVAIDPGIKYASYFLHMVNDSEIYNTDLFSLEIYNPYKYRQRIKIKIEQLSEQIYKWFMNKDFDSLNEFYSDYTAVMRKILNFDAVALSILSFRYVLDNVIDKYLQIINPSDVKDILFLLPMTSFTEDLRTLLLFAKTRKINRKIITSEFIYKSFNFIILYYYWEVIRMVLKRKNLRYIFVSELNTSDDKLFGKYSKTYSPNDIDRKKHKYYVDFGEINGVPIDPDLFGACNILHKFYPNLIEEKVKYHAIKYDIIKGLSLLCKVPYITEYNDERLKLDDVYSKIFQNNIIFRPLLRKIKT